MESKAKFSRLEAVFQLSQHIDSQIQLADVKAGLLLTANALLLTALARVKVMETFVGQGTLLFLWIAVVLALLAIMPRLGRSKSACSFPSIAASENATKFTRSFVQYSPQMMIRAVLRSVHVRSKIVNAKMVLIKAATACSLLSLVAACAAHIVSKI